MLAILAPIVVAQLCHPAADDGGGGDEDEMDMSQMSEMDMSHMDMKPVEKPAVTARADGEFDVASIDAGDYYGFVPSVSIAWWRLEARIAAPIYHLEYRGVKSDGPGDLLWSLSGTIVQQRHLRFGAAIAVTEATGNEKVGLGMGDRMYMPNLWASWNHGRWGAIASASYGRMAGDVSEHAMHLHLVGSLVNPMNHEELAGGLRFTYRATHELRLHVLGSIATPIELEGTTRAYAAAGIRWTMPDGWDVGGEADLGLTGDPFHARMVFDLARAF